MVVFLEDDEWRWTRLPGGTLMYHRVNQVFVSSEMGETLLEMMGVDQERGCVQPASVGHHRQQLAVSAERTDGLLAITCRILQRILTAAESRSSVLRWASELPSPDPTIRRPH